METVTKTFTASVPGCYCNLSAFDIIAVYLNIHNGVICVQMNICILGYTLLTFYNAVLVWIKSLHLIFITESCRLIRSIQSCQKSRPLVLCFFFTVAQQ